MTKKIFFTSALFLFMAFLVNPCRAQKDPSPDPRLEQFQPTATLGVIKEFKVTAKINKDSSIDVIETIIYDFGQFNRHGIFRTIPVKYQIKQAQGEISRNIKNAKTLGTQYNLRLHDVSVTDQRAVPYLFKKEKQGDYFQIKVGDPDSFVQGEKTYVIKYKVWRALGFFDDHVELYWNVTGNEWQEPILKSSFEITLPEKIDQSKLRQACYTGAAGSTQNFCLGEITGDNQVSFKLEQGFFLKSNQGLTAVLSWPPGIVQPVSKIQEYRWILEDNLGTIYAFVAPVAAFVLLFIFWFRRGRDPQGKGTIIARFYPPEDLTAQEVGTIVDEKADNVDISSLIISLAVKGYLKIKELPGKKIFGLTTGKDYLFTQLAQDISKLEDFEKKFLTAVFDAAKETKLSDLKNKFYKQLPEIRQALYQSTVDKGYFPKNPEKTRGAFIGLGVAAAVLGLIFGFALFQSGFAAVANLIIGLMIIVFGFFMPRRTAKGVNAKEHILGLKEYLGVAEADRIKFHNAPEKKPETFEKLLPFAMVLGVEKQWAKQFEDIYQNPPQWFEGSAPDHFSSFYLVNSLFSLQNAANAAFVSSPGGGAGSGGSGFSSGGGSSGGGFGGGGGGSW